jgi:hypothetical protein
VGRLGAPTATPLAGLALPTSRNPYAA